MSSEGAYNHSVISEEEVPMAVCARFLLGLSF